jgi:DNA modification methylase
LAIVADEWVTRAGDSLVLMGELEAGSVDAVITDPPYSIGIVGKKWDSHDDFESWSREWASLALRALRPGGYLISFAATRTYHKMASGVEAAGFEIRDMLTWLYGQGYPAGKNVEVDGELWSSGLKPSAEPMVLARKPLPKVISDERTGRLNIDATRVGDSGGSYDQGRWPANVVVDEEAAALLDSQAGLRVRPSRFYYCPKPDSVQKDAGLADGGFELKDRDTFKISGKGSQGYNLHPTVKPVDLMRWLVRLVTPRGGLVLDPFMGSGSTGLAVRAEGCRFMGFDLDPEYVRLADARYDYMTRGGQL